MQSLEAYMVVDSAGKPARLVNAEIAPVHWTASSALRLAASRDRLARVGVPGSPHRVVAVTIQEVVLTGRGGGVPTPAANSSRVPAAGAVPRDSPRPPAKAE